MLNNGPLETQAQCFFTALLHQPFASGLILANLITSAPNSLALEQIKQKITQPSLACIIREYHQTSLAQRALMDPSTRESFEHLFQTLLKEDAWALKLNETALMLLGHQACYTRWVLYRLMQQANPEQNGEIPVALFDEAGLEHSFESVACAYKIYTQLPEHLLELCSDTPIAHIVMKDLSEHPQRFGFIESLIEKYPELASSVAHDWQQLLATNPLPTVQAEQIRACARRLGLNYPAFEGLSEQQRLQRVPPNDPKRFSMSKDNLSKLLASGWTLLNAPRLATWSQMAYTGLRGLALNTPGPSMTAMSYSTCAVFVPLMAPIALYAGVRTFWPTILREIEAPQEERRAQLTR